MSLGSEVRLEILDRLGLEADEVVAEDVPILADVTDRAAALLQAHMHGRDVEQDLRVVKATVARLGLKATMRALGTTWDVWGILVDALVTVVTRAAQGFAAGLAEDLR